ncbi:MAG TPA: cytochrome c3 family protein [bacterium]|nr:cytochrome c3 family protein [bacterium]HMY34639.1 cytochrome c3 family protein [bacterium]HMZ03828.1 cytochrome c3 family protein [bacterium]HNB11052.1 cytochrome c3 family protein [bacterium]HNB58121.1 cytochrome c3 family protein [bacterium]
MRQHMLFSANTRNFKILRTMAGVCLAVFFVSCGHDHAQGLLEKLDTAPAWSDSAYTHVAPTADTASLHAVQLVERPLYVVPRTPLIKKYPCTECHTKPLGQMKSSDPSGRKAHWDKNLQHATTNVLQCTVCHDERNLNNLRSITGAVIAFNDSYQLCQQCHSRQFNDWQGGAHGKRVGGWAPPRTVALCVECHNPHQPRWDIRWPAQPSLTMQRLIK